MALAATARGTAAENTSDTSFALTPSGNLAAGSWAVLVVGVDNSETNGVAHTTFTVTDSQSNTWTRRISPLNDPGNANEGSEGGIFTTPQDGGTLTTGDTITVTLGVNTTAKVMALWEATAAASISYVTGGVNAGSFTATPTITTASITSGDMVIAAGFFETSVDAVGDADTTNGNWSSQQRVESGGITTNAQQVTTQWKTVSATATQTYNPTNATSTNMDTILGYVVLAEAAGNVTVTPTTLALVLATFAPTVTAGTSPTVTPTTATLNLSTFAPTVTATGGTVRSFAVVVS